MKLNCQDTIVLTTLGIVLIALFTVPVNDDHAAPPHDDACQYILTDTPNGTGNEGHHKPVSNPLDHNPTPPYVRDSE